MEAALEYRGERLGKLLEMEWEAEIDQFDNLFKTNSIKELEKLGLCVPKLSIGEI